MLNCHLTHHWKDYSGFTTIVNPDSDSFFLSLNLKWGFKDSVTSKTLCESVSKTLNSESTSELTLSIITERTSHMIEVEAWEDTLFNSNHINTSVENIICFQFLKLNHTLTQLTLDHLCTLSDEFNFDFQFFNPLNQINKTLTFIIQITDLIWFFCH